MPKMRVQLTPEVQEAICQFVRAGGYLHVACVAAGVPFEVVEGWLHSARKSNAKPRYKEFALAVRQAEAQARLKAEIAILKDSPLDWLKSGPGKELLNLPGWTAPTKPLIQNNTQMNVMLAPELQQLMAAILKVLAPFPEARMAVAQALAAASETGTVKRQNLKQIVQQQQETQPQQESEQES